jgi:ABC-type branched-subunit amino acid transport system ATPase component
LSILETIAERICVLGEEHRVVAEGTPHDVLSDHDLLHRCNLSHYHIRQTK